MKKNEAIKHYGGVVQLAAALGITSQSVSQWGDTVPPRRAYEIERLTGGQLKAESPQTIPTLTTRQPLPATQ